MVFLTVPILKEWHAQRRSPSRVRLQLLRACVIHASDPAWMHGWDLAFRKEGGWDLEHAASALTSACARPTKVTELWEIMCLPPFDEITRRSCSAVVLQTPEAVSFPRKDAQMSLLRSIFMLSTSRQTRLLSNGGTNALTAVTHASYLQKSEWEAFLKAMVPMFPEGVDALGMLIGPSLTKEEKWLLCMGVAIPLAMSHACPAVSSRIQHWTVLDQIHTLLRALGHSVPPVSMGTFHEGALIENEKKARTAWREQASSGAMNNVRIPEADKDAQFAWKTKKDKAILFPPFVKTFSRLLLVSKNPPRSFVKRCDARMEMSMEEEEKGDDLVTPSSVPHIAKCPTMDPDVLSDLRNCLETPGESFPSLWNDMWYQFYSPCTDPEDAESEDEPILTAGFSPCGTREWRWLIRLMPTFFFANMDARDAKDFEDRKCVIIQPGNTFYIHKTVEAEAEGGGGGGGGETPIEFGPGPPVWLLPRCVLQGPFIYGDPRVTHAYNMGNVLTTLKCRLPVPAQVVMYKKYLFLRSPHTINDIPGRDMKKVVESRPLRWTRRLQWLRGEFWYPTTEFWDTVMTLNPKEKRERMLSALHVRLLLWMMMRWDPVQAPYMPFRHELLMFQQIPPDRSTMLAFMDQVPSWDALMHELFSPWNDEPVPEEHDPAARREVIACVARIKEIAGKVRIWNRVCLERLKWVSRLCESFA